MIREQEYPSEADRRSRLGRWASASKSPDAPTEDHIKSQHGGRARFDAGLGSSSRRACQPDGWTLKSKRKGTGDRGDDSVYEQNESQPRRPRRDPSDTLIDQSGDEWNPRGSRRRDFGRYEWPDSPWLKEGHALVKRVVMKPPCFSGKGSVRTLLAKFDNCARYN